MGDKWWCFAANQTELCGWALAPYTDCVVLAEWHLALIRFMVFMTNIIVCLCGFNRTIKQWQILIYILDAVLSPLFVILCMFLKTISTPFPLMNNLVTQLSTHDQTQIQAEIPSLTQREDIERKRRHSNTVWGLRLSSFKVSALLTAPAKVTLMFGVGVECGQPTTVQKLSPHQRLWLFLFSVEMRLKSSGAEISICCNIMSLF